MNTVPMVVRRTPDGERAMDIASLLLQDRVVSFSTEVNDASAELIMMQLLYLDSLGNDPIKLYINSPGGSVSAGFAIHDTMKMLKSPVWTVGAGICASMGAFLLASGDKRLILENAEVMIHQPLGGMRGPASDISNVRNSAISAQLNAADFGIGINQGFLQLSTNSNLEIVSAQPLFIEVNVSSKEN